MKQLLTLTVVVILFAVPASAQLFLKIGDIKGESLNDNHKDWIIIENMSWEMQAPFNAKTGKIGDATKGPLIISKEIDRSSSDIMSNLFNGEEVTSVMIEDEGDTKVSGTSKEVYLRYELTNVTVTSYSISNDSGGRPHESVTLNFEEIKVTYYYYDKAGKRIMDPAFSGKWN